VVLIFCTVRGWKDGYLVQVTDARKIYSGTFLGESCSAIQMTTAASICAALDLHVSGKLPASGFVRQEEVKLEDFLKNRFGKCYTSAAEDVSADRRRIEPRFTRLSNSI
jgi:saccharopine dehydrogenase-like NADP-dependent oxidoreductase